MPFIKRLNPRKVAAAVLLILTALSSSAFAQGAKFCGGLGVGVRPMTRPFADSLGMISLYGAIFGRPRPGSPAAHAHIESGDVLTAINGSPLSSARDFAPAMAKFAPGTTVYFRTYRSGQLIDRAVTLAYGKCRT